jgi:UDP-N-acetylmuramate: L-alanyl-gamma-D-glutamyl-meso-diaminopimelate ligase
VLAVAGTHGKTSTASLLAWILEDAGMEPGFLIGGVPRNFGISARLGGTPFFVVEADEYDTAFFDKRSKFVHYRPRTLILNNLEFDHADIFDDLAMIQRQFHHLVRTIPGNGLIIAPEEDLAISQVLDMGCWTLLERFSATDNTQWHSANSNPENSQFEIHVGSEKLGSVDWELHGQHNLNNALAAVAAARHAGVPPAIAIDALSRFKNVKRRMELRGEVAGVTVYDDFAHHPTAIATTLEGLRASVGSERILAVLEPRSNTMRMGVHAGQLATSLEAADQVLVFAPSELEWDAATVLGRLDGKLRIFDSVDAIIAALGVEAKSGDHILIMSNGGFGNIHQRLLDCLKEEQT